METIQHILGKASFRHWLPAFAGMTDLETALKNTSFPRRLESSALVLPSAKYAEQLRKKIFVVQESEIISALARKSNTRPVTARGPRFCRATPPLFSGQYEKQNGGLLDVGRRFVFHSSPRFDADQLIS